MQRLNPQLQDIAVATARTFYGPALTSQLGQNHNVNAPTSQLQLSQGGGGVTNQTFTYNAGVDEELHVAAAASLTATLNNSRQATNSQQRVLQPAVQLASGRSTTRSRCCAISRSTRSGAS